MPYATRPMNQTEVTMDSLRVEGGNYTEVIVRIPDSVLVAWDLDELDQGIVRRAERPNASIADALLALEALVRHAEHGRPSKP